MPSIGTNFFDILVSGQFDIYRGLLHSVDQQIDRDLIKFGQKMQDSANQDDDEYSQWMYQEFIVDEYVQREEHKGVFLDAIFVALFAFFEHELTRLCDNARNKVNCPWSVTEFGHNNRMGKAKDYLKKLGIDFPADSQAWSAAKKYQTIRNRIVHVGNTLKEEEKDLIDFAKGKEILVEGALPDGSKKFTVQLTSDFCDVAISDVEMVVIEVNRAYWQWHQGKAP